MEKEKAEGKMGGRGRHTAGLNDKVRGQSEGRETEGPHANLNMGKGTCTNIVR